MAGCKDSIRSEAKASYVVPKGTSKSLFANIYLLNIYVLFLAFIGVNCKQISIFTRAFNNELQTNQYIYTGFLINEFKLINSHLDLGMVPLAIYIYDIRYRNIY